MNNKDIFTPESQLLTMDNLDLKMQLTSAERLAAELRNKLERLTAVHTFDPEDKSTWPEDGMWFVIANPDQNKKEIVLPCIRLEDRIEYASTVGSVDMIIENNAICGYLWSYSPPALQAQLASLKDTNE